MLGVLDAVNAYAANSNDEGGIAGCWMLDADGRC